MVVYDSSAPFGRATANTFSQVELNSLTSRESAIKLNETLKDNFNSYIYRTREQVKNIKDFVGLSDDSISVSYDRNGTEHLAILNPVYVIDKLPNYSGIRSYQPQGYQIGVAFL